MKKEFYNIAKLVIENSKILIFYVFQKKKLPLKFTTVRRSR